MSQQYEKENISVHIQFLAYLELSIKVTYVLFHSLFSLTDATHEEALRVSQYCHSHDIAFILASTKGLFGNIFCDFGKEFEVVDTNGESPVSAMVAGISKEVSFRNSSFFHYKEHVFFILCIPKYSSSITLDIFFQHLSHSRGTPLPLTVFLCVV